MSESSNKSIFPQYKLDHASFSTLRFWWLSLEDDKGERAYLRRSYTLTEIMLSPAFHRLLNQLGREKIPQYRYPKLAIIAGLISRIEGESQQKLGAEMGSPTKSSTKPDVAELRMRRILACDDLEELYVLLRRALSLVDNRVNIYDLASIVWHWTPMDDKSPHDPRRRLACDYYAEAPLQ
jgi:CRISPR system Cascade subunit CasB